MNSPTGRGSSVVPGSLSSAEVLRQRGPVAVADLGGGGDVVRGSGSNSPRTGTGQSGSSPVSAQAACRAAPTATLSNSSVATMGSPKTAERDLADRLGL